MPADRPARLACEFADVIEQVIRSLRPFLRHTPTHVTAHLIGERRLVIYLPEGQEVRLPLPDSECLDDGDGWEPTQLQRKILDALDGRALRTDALAAAVNRDRRRLFEEAGLNGLMTRGLVKNSEEKGYWRADAPPPDLA